MPYKYMLRNRFVHVYGRESGRICFSSIKATLTGNNLTNSNAEQDASSFEDIGLSPQLCGALRKCGKNFPTTIQKSTFELIRSGSDVAIAAETGSGKTLAYVLPILQRMEENGIARDSLLFPSVVILVPNKDLCRQVHQMVNEVLSAMDTAPSHDHPIRCAALTNVTGHWPFEKRDGGGDVSRTCPDIVICTPALLGSFVKGPRLLQPLLYQALRVVILDEADLLLDGSYQKDVEKLMDALKVTRRRSIREGHMKIHERMVQFVLAAATIPTSGTRSVDRYISRFFPLVRRVTTNFLHRHHPFITQKFVELKLDSLPDRVTMSDHSKEEAEWEERVDAVVTALQSADSSEPDTSDKESNQPSDLTMIFCNTSESCAAMVSDLRSRGVDCGEFHKGVPAYSRDAMLDAFRDGQLHILVCTDAASRGLDIPSVRHVIQAEFAPNVVQHMHRVGRASRAGAQGWATNIYSDDNRDLVESILSTQDAVDGECGSVNQSFSRRRAFRRNIKRAQARNDAANERNDHDNDDDVQMSTDESDAVVSQE